MYYGSSSTLFVFPKIPFRHLNRLLVVVVWVERKYFMIISSLSIYLSKNVLNNINITVATRLVTYVIMIDVNKNVMGVQKNIFYHLMEFNPKIPWWAAIWRPDVIKTEWTENVCHVPELLTMKYTSQRSLYREFIPYQSATCAPINEQRARTAGTGWC